MKRKLKISSSFSGVVATGSYENSRPGFAVEEEFEMEGEQDVIDFAIQTRQEALHIICYERFKEVEQQMVVERIQKERKDIRFYTDETGKKYPSVTSIINFDADFFMDERELVQYASRGSITHARVNHYIKTGKWVEAKELPECWTDIVIVQKGDLNLTTNVGNFPGFLEKYPITELKNSEMSFNKEYEYAGTPDFEGTPDFKEAEKLPSLWDVKSTIDKIKLMMQLAAYAKMEKYKHIKQVGGIEISDKTQQGFSRPVVETRIDEYFQMFLNKRKSFRQRYGI